MERIENVEKMTKEEGVEKLFNFRPIFFLAVSMCFGIVFAYLHIVKGLSAKWQWGLLPLSLALFFVCANKKKADRTLLAVVLLVCGFFFGSGLAQNQMRDYQNTRHYDGAQIVQGRIVEIEEKDWLSVIVLDDIKIAENLEKGKLNATLPTPFVENLSVSDLVIFETEVSTNPLVVEGELALYDLVKDVRFSCTVDEYLQAVGHREDVFSAIRARMREVLEVGMSKDSARITMAMLTGDSAGIEIGLLENIRAGGIAHIFAVSGLHVGVLYTFCQKAFDKKSLKKAPKWARFLLIFTVLFVYAGVCGFTTSVMRATILCLVVCIARMLGMETDFLQTLGVSAIVIFLCSPMSLFQVGFQLSFTACLGLALLSRPIRETLTAGAECGKTWIKKVLRLDEKARPNPEKDIEDTPLSISERVRKWCIDVLSISLSAQIATSPILLNTYGYLSGWSIVLNVIFVPILSAFFSLLLAIVFLACVLPTGIAPLLLYVPSIVWSALLLLFEDVDFSSFCLSGFFIPMGGMVAYYGGCTFLSDKWNLSKRGKIWCVMGCFAVGLAVVGIVYFST